MNQYLERLYNVSQSLMPKPSYHPVCNFNYVFVCSEVDYEYKCMCYIYMMAMMTSDVHVLYFHDGDDDVRCLKPPYVLYFHDGDDDVRCACAIFT